MPEEKETGKIDHGDSDPNKSLPMRNNVSLKFEGQIKHKNKQRYGEAGELVNKSETKYI